MLRFMRRLGILACLAAGWFLVPAAIPVTPGQVSAHAQDSPLEILQRRQQPRIQRQSGVRVISGQPRRVQVSRGRGLFTNLEQPAGVTIFEQRAPRRRIILATEGESPLDVLMKNRRARSASRVVSPEVFVPAAAIPAPAPRAGRNASNIIDLKDGGAGGTSGQSYCVRTCDGFFFPVGDAGGARDSAAQQLACNAMCPAAPTKLFTAPPGSDGIAEAISGNLSYSRMPNAFLYQTRLDKACTCNGRSPLGLVSLAVKADYTLDQGDVIMTKDGLKVLASTRYPHTEKSFVPAIRSKRLSARERDGLRGLETGGRTAQLSKRDRKQAAAAAEILEELLIEEPVADAQQLVRYLGANPAPSEEAAAQIGE